MKHYIGKIVINNLNLFSFNKALYINPNDCSVLNNKG